MENIETGNRNSNLYYDSKPSETNACFKNIQIPTSKILMYVVNPVIQKEGLDEFQTPFTALTHISNILSGL